MKPEVTVLALQDIKEGMRAVVPFSVSDEDMQRFAEFSGDFNPLHTDARFARNKGFDGAVVYGALMIAKLSQLIGMQLPGRDSVWVSINMDFKKPLFVGQLAEAVGVVADVSESTNMVELRLSVSVAEKVIAKGRAEVLLVAA